jgi:signal transduction histidine kinase
VLPNLPEVLTRQVERIDSLVKQLLDVSRAREGRLEVERRRFDLVPAAAVLVAQYQTLRRRHEFVWRPPGVPAMVDGDERRLEQVLANLLDNAVKYSPAGGRIEVSLHVEGGRVRVAVADQGIGIPADELPRLFERFRRARNASSSRFGGFGLGLFIAREIVRLHDGDLRVESEEGKGTRIEFDLPLAPSDSQTPSSG